MICDCKEKCLLMSVTRTSKEGKSEKIERYKCNRLPSDGVKKQPCTFIKEIIIDNNIVLSERKLLHENTIISNTKNNENTQVTKSVILTKKNHLIEELNKLLKFYDTPGTNYFGKLNNYLQRLGYDIHDPPTESLDELINRLSKKPNKSKSEIFINADSVLSKTLGEFKFDLDEEKEINRRILLKEDPFEFKKDPFIKELLAIKVVSNKSKPKSHKPKLNKPKLNKQKLVNKTEYLDDENIDEEDNNSEEEVSDKEDNHDEDEDEEINNNKNNIDNEFDIENYSEDDDFEDNEYEDFSD